ncbi:MAG: DUF2254 domain-containing protein, partial [Planctomycetaceae bacterium]|nr:DUF2254 domain-containing protein [Planctomycetaceae bacterium]
CILVLRTVRGGSSTVFTPHISTALGVGLAIFSLAVFIGFIHHVATTLQAQTVITSVTDELNETIDRLYPHPPRKPKPEQPDSTEAFDSSATRRESSSPLHGFAVVRTIGSRSAGYLQALDQGTLRYLAESSGSVLRVMVLPGDFLGVGQPVLEVLRPAEPTPFSPDEDFDSEAASAFLTGSRRTPRQDVGCGVLELVEMAVRALSPGINDPFTAQSCVDYLSDSLCRLATRPGPSTEYRGDDGNLCVITRELPFADVLDIAIRPIRFHAGGSLLVIAALLRGLHRIARQVQTVSTARAVLEQADAVVATARDSFKLPVDVRTAETLHDHVTSLVLERFPAITEDSLQPLAVAAE